MSGLPCLPLTACHHPIHLSSKSVSHVQLFATPWTVAYQTHPSMGFSRQECWSQLPFPSPGDLPDPGIELRSPALQADASPSEPEGLTQNTRAVKQKIMTARDPKALSERSSWDHLRLRTQVYWLPAAAVTKNCKLGCLKQQKVWKPEVQNQGANGPGPLQRL